MAHYALLDDNNIVQQVIVGNEEGGSTNWEEYYQTVTGKNCKRTSYNTSKGVHTTGGTQFRKNYAGIGYTYDESRDAFIPPKPFPSWILNEAACVWESPTPPPQTESNEYSYWDESTTSWIINVIPS